LLKDKLLALDSSLPKYDVFPIGKYIYDVSDELVVCIFTVPTILFEESSLQGQSAMSVDKYSPKVTTPFRQV